VIEEPVKRTYGWAQRHDYVRELMGRLTTDATLADVWPELDDLGQFGTRRLLDAYEQAERAGERGRGYGKAVAQLERALWAAARDAKALGNPRPAELLSRAGVQDEIPD